ncbi:MAG: acetoin utilization protein AcuC [Sedimentisphaerales bacterium]|nr:acetoin utilization protein AcuC [Sedimentisphaerales bacterium]
MAERKAIFLHCDELENHPYPDQSPFKTSRAGGVKKTIESMGLLSRPNTKQIEPTAADEKTLQKFHTPKYLKALKEADDGRVDAEFLFMGIGTGDCPIFRGMYDYSALACGASLGGVEQILSKKAALAFNPSGGLHHAKPQQASGFCYMNDVALACLVLAENSKRVLYLDIDVHHGDGVQQAFYDRNDVMTISFHQDGRTLFPGTGFVEDIGTGAGIGYSVNVPLVPGTYDDIYLKAFNEIVPPLFGKYKPDVIVFELGADTLSGDPLAQLYLTNNIYAAIIKKLLTFNVPILMTGGGGYNVDNTVRAWSLAWSVLCGADDEQVLNIGLGGVLMETKEWQGGLRDRNLVPSEYQRQSVDPQVEAVIEEVKQTIFPLHGL